MKTTHLIEAMDYDVISNIAQRKESLTLRFPTLCHIRCRDLSNNIPNVYVKLSRFPLLGPFLYRSLSSNYIIKGLRMFLNHNKARDFKSFHFDDK